MAFGAGFYFFNISQWVLAYQYLYAAIIIPVILSEETSEEQVKKNKIKEVEAKKKLYCSNYFYVIFATVCCLLNELWRFTDSKFDDEIMPRIRVFDIISYLVVLGFFLFAICRIKSF